jgi:Spy/CpxP family protein refolding chaperone
MKTSKVLVFLLAVLLITSSAYAAVGGQDKPGDNPQFHHPGMHGHNLLNLTPDQRTKLKEIWDNFRKETVFLRNDLKVKKLELRALWTVPQPEKDKIVTKQKEIIEMSTQLKMKAIDTRLEARKVLTPEQAAQVGMWGPEMWHRSHMKNRRMMD